MQDRKEWVKLMQEAETQGWRVERTNGGHLKWVAPNGKVVFTAYSASDKRAIKNSKSLLRAAGFIEVTKKGNK